GVPGNDHPITPANRYYAADIPVREYDPDKAKHYLKQAGHDTLQVNLSAAASPVRYEDRDKAKHYLKQAGHDTLQVNLSAADAAFLGAVDTAVLFKEQAAKAGIDINILREPDDGCWADVW